jgi:hypothetical protein
LLGEVDDTLHTSDLLLVDGIDIGKNCVLPRGLESGQLRSKKGLTRATHHLLGNIDFLLDCQNTLLDGAFHVDLLNVSTGRHVVCV